jgi:hypothetical protein
VGFLGKIIFGGITSTLGSQGPSTAKGVFAFEQLSQNLAIHSQIIITLYSGSRLM